MKIYGSWAMQNLPRFIPIGKHQVKNNFFFFSSFSLTIPDWDETWKIFCRLVAMYFHNLLPSSIEQYWSQYWKFINKIYLLIIFYVARWNNILSQIINLSTLIWSFFCLLLNLCVYIYLLLMVGRINTRSEKWNLKSQHPRGRALWPTKKCLSSPVSISR